MAIVAGLSFGLALFSVSVSPPASAAVGINHQINFQGKLVNLNGTNVTDGSYSVVFSIYNVASAGANLWTETQPVTVTNGIFQVNLGSVTTLPASVDFNTDNIYLGIKVGADAEMTPRVQFTSVPQAFNSEKLGGLDKTGFIQNGTAQQATSNFNISGTGVANILQATIFDTNTAIGLNFGTTNASSLTIAKVGVVTTVAGGLSVGQTATISGNLTINGPLFTNTGATLLTTSTLADFPTGGSIGTAATTVDVKTSFLLNQTTAGQTLTLPSPTTTTAGRTIYVSNVGTTSFTISTAVLNPGITAAYFWNGAAWTSTGIDTGVTLVGTVDSRTASANGAVISGNTVYLQSASATNPGLINTGAQILAGAKSFTGSLSVAQAAVFGANVGINNATPANPLSINTLTTLAAASSAQVAISTNGTANRGLVLQGVASQTADLLQLQNSSGTVLGSFDANGGLTIAANNNVLASAATSGTTATAGINVTGQKGGNTTGTTGQLAGTGASQTILGGAGGDAPAGSTNGNGGSLTLNGGAAGAGLGVAGVRGTITIQGTGGSTFINGSTQIQPAIDTTSSFNIKSSITNGGNNIFSVDTLNTRVGIGLSSNFTPTLAAGTNGLEILGALRLSGSAASYEDLFLTPVGSLVTTKINVPVFDPGAFNQVLAFGIPANAATNSRVLSVFDARTGAQSVHQPSIALFTPDESTVFGLSTEGSNTTGYLKMTGGNIALRSGSSDLLFANQAGNISIGNSNNNYKLDVTGDVNLSPIFAPVSAPTTVDAGAGSLAAATYYYVYSYATSTGITDYSSQSAGLAITANHNITVSVANSPVFSQITKNIYRSTVSGGPYNLVGSIADNVTTTFTDSNTNPTTTAKNMNSTALLRVYGAAALNTGNATNRNTFVGLQAGNSNTTGVNNTFVGNAAGQNITTGINNTAIGLNAGYQDPNVAAFVSGVTLQNATTIGYGAQVQTSNSLILGGQDTNAVNVGIGTTIPLNTFSVSPLDVSAGTVSQSTTTVTGVGTSFTSAMIGEQFIFGPGQTGTITAVAGPLSLTLSTSQTVASTNYRIHRIGLQVTTGGNVGIGTATPIATLQVAGTGVFRNVSDSATAFQIQNAAGASMFTANASGLIIAIGSAITDTVQINLQLDSYSIFADSGACNATTSQGSLYYNTASSTVRGCVNSNWDDITTTRSLGLSMYGVMLDSGSGGGDLVSVASLGVSGPCRVSFLTTTTVKIVQGCTAYSGGRKIIIPDNTTPTGSLPLATAGDFTHVCLTGTGGQPAFSVSGPEAANLPAFSASAPVVCLADIKAGAAVIANIYDVRTFSTSIKSFATINAAVGVGLMVRGNGFAGQVALTATATDASIRGIVVASSGVASTTGPNVIIVTTGPQYVKAAGTSGSNAAIIPTTTVGYSGTGTNASAYGTVGLSQRTIDTACTLTTNCQFSQVTEINIR